MACMLLDNNISISIGNRPPKFLALKIITITITIIIKYVHVNMLFVYPRSTKEFTRTRSEMPVHSRIELEFGNFGFLRRGENRSSRRKKLSKQSREPTTNSTHI